MSFKYIKLVCVESIPNKILVLVNGIQIRLTFLEIVTKIFLTKEKVYFL